MSKEKSLLEAGERRDCAVYTLAAVAGIPYADAHAALKAAGRRARCGTKTRVMQAALLACGLRVERRMYPRAPRRLVLDHVRPLGAFVVRSTGHLFAVVDGKVHDCWPGQSPRAALREVWELLPTFRPRRQETMKQTPVPAIGNHAERLQQINPMTYSDLIDAPKGGNPVTRRRALRHAKALEHLASAERDMVRTFNRWAKLRAMVTRLEKQLDRDMVAEAQAGRL
jgi:hypothetical protein